MRITRLSATLVLLALVSAWVGRGVHLFVDHWGGFEQQRHWEEHPHHTPGHFGAHHAGHAGGAGDGHGCDHGDDDREEDLDPPAAGCHEDHAGDLDASHAHHDHPWCDGITITHAIPGDLPIEAYGLDLERVDIEDDAQVEPRFSSRTTRGPPIL